VDRGIERFAFTLAAAYDQRRRRRGRRSARRARGLVGR
jgi:hypothetical protein